jgi:hypothetical protein
VFAPKYAAGDRVRVVADCPDAQLRGLLVTVYDPSPAFGGKVNGWENSYWKADTNETGGGSATYWIAFECHPPPGSARVAGAEGEEAWLERP